MAAPAQPDHFDPLVELHGLWNTELAERYLPIEGLPSAKYECLDGNLIMSPREGSANSYAAVRLAIVLDQPARAAAAAVYSTVNLQLTPSGWIEPDLTILRKPVKNVTWVLPHQVLMPIEFVSKSSVRRDRIDKPTLCAEVAIPYFMRVEITEDEAHVELLRLVDDHYVRHAKALSGQEFRTELPFPIAFDPAQLLEP